MEQEEKQLLLKDLCARLPYAVKAYMKKWSELDNKYYEGVYIVEAIDPSLNAILAYSEECADEAIASYDDDYEIKPYLFPLSNMSEDQRKYITDRWGINEESDFEINPDWGEYIVELGDIIDYIDWLNENHFDYRGLIEKGLAIDATGLGIY